MKLWALFMVCFAVTSIECEVDNAPEVEIKTLEQALEALIYIIDTRAVVIINTLIDKKTDDEKGLLKAAYIVKKTKDRKKLSVNDEAITKYIKSPEVWKLIKDFKQVTEKLIRRDKWRKAKIARHKKGRSNIRYYFGSLILKTKKSHKLFEERLKLYSKLSEMGGVSDMIACRVESDYANIIYAIEEDKFEPYDDKLVKMSEVKRREFYVLAGTLLLNVGKAGGFVERLIPFDLQMNSLNVNSTVFTVLENLYPQIPYLENVRDDFLHYELVRPNVNFLDFQAKYILKHFIEACENRREIRINDIERYKRRGNKSDEKSVKIDKKPISEDFLDIVAKMLYKTKSLAEVVEDMKKGLKETEGGSGRSLANRGVAPLLRR